MASIAATTSANRLSPSAAGSCSSGPIPGRRTSSHKASCNRPLSSELGSSAGPIVDGESVVSSTRNLGAGAVAASRFSASRNSLNWSDSQPRFGICQCLVEPKVAYYESIAARKILRLQ